MKKFALVIGFLLSGIGFPANANEIPEFPFIFVKGTAEKEVPPDVANVSFNIEDFNEDPAAAVEIVRGKSLELIEFFKKQKIEEENIIAYEVTKKSVRERKDFQYLDILGYEVSRRFKVTLKNIKKYPVVVEKLMSFENVVNIDSVFNRTDREEFERKLLLEASRKASEEGKNLADGFGVKLGPVFAISREQFRLLSEKFGLSADFGPSAMFAGKPKVLMVPSTITLHASVNVIFRLGEK